MRAANRRSHPGGFSASLPLRAAMLAASSGPPEMVPANRLAISFRLATKSGRVLQRVSSGVSGDG
jgi:hypothetical protein